jgi:serine/threonine protein kinase
MPGLLALDLNCVELPPALKDLNERTSTLAYPICMPHLWQHGVLLGRGRDGAVFEYLGVVYKAHMRLNLANIVAEALALEMMAHNCGAAPFMGAYVTGSAIVLCTVSLGVGTVALEALPEGDARARGAVVGAAKDLECLHANHLVHGDVRPGNIVVTPEGRGHLIDYEFACTEPDVRLPGWHACGAERYENGNLDGDVHRSVARDTARMSMILGGTR